ncbi:hypothetical protein SELMODRAFT_402645 [Selaginella moellendorffii]|uniref:Uncharacterized protein n=1 Tax=Selaginella moellendorffii TaxID=88036 RepID=D8QMK9_SELML|nr:hypothetical protein SELMODRAFT_402645 [Selaginella moellendorffii]
MPRAGREASAGKTGRAVLLREWLRWTSWPGYWCRSCSTTTCICRDKLLGGAGAYGKHVDQSGGCLYADWPMKPIVSLATARIMRKWDDEGRSRELYILHEERMDVQRLQRWGDEHFITDDKGVVRVHNRVKCRQSDSAIADLARESPPFSGVTVVDPLRVQQAMQSNMGGRGRP